MLMPSIFSDNFFDDWMDDFSRTANVDKQLYGKNAARVMKTDVRETEDGYEVEIDLPGFKKDQINLQLENGYLTISAAKGLDKEEKKDGRVIRQERYSGAMQRSFYVGEGVDHEDVKAKFEDGVLKLDIPKKSAKLPEKKTIMIEG
jgi:HSP20 family protein